MNAAVPNPACLDTLVAAADLPNGRVRALTVLGLGGLALATVLGLLFTAAVFGYPSGGLA